VWYFLIFLKYNFFCFKKLINVGFFYASAFENQSVISLTSDPLNKYLISGDTKGFIYIWDIEEYKIDGNSNFEESPNCIKSWRAHDDNVESCQFVSSLNGIYDGELIITASSDWCCRLWTIQGTYIGK
jgi:WD40 repeat protein